MDEKTMTTNLEETACEMLAALKMVYGKLDDWNQTGPTITQIKAAIRKGNAALSNSERTDG